MKKILNLSLFALVSVTILTLSSCNKKEDTLAVITVLDAANQTVAGATVQLTAEPTPEANGGPAVAGELIWNEPLTSKTNSAGEATFNFNDIYKKGQAGVVVANISASYDGSTGQGIIKVEQEVTSEETVYISQ